MQIGSMKEVLLTSAKDTYLFNCRVAGLDPQTLSEYRDVLGSFIRFTGDRLVRELTPDHVRTYIATLDDYPDRGTEHIRLVMDHYVVIHTWIRWLFAQKFITQRYSSAVKPPRQPGRLDVWMARIPACAKTDLSEYNVFVCSDVWRNGERNRLIHDRLKVRLLPRPLYDCGPFCSQSILLRNLLAPQTKHLYNCNSELRHKPRWFSYRTLFRSTSFDAKCAA